MKVTEEMMVNLRCRRLTIPEGGSSGELLFEDKEMVYYITGGYAQLVVCNPDVDWQYPVQSQTGIWVPENTKHVLKNVGIGNLECVVFENKI
ncbi:MAG TPA: hypothetical protein VIL66_03995 [Bacillota bacterium]